MFFTAKQREIEALKVQKAMREVELENKILGLKKEISELRIARDKLTSDLAMRERDVEHKVGLLRLQVEQEREHTTRMAKLTVREENLAKDQKRFEEQMQFHQSRFDEETKYLKDMVKQILDRLPNVKVGVENITKTTNRGG